MKLTRLLPAAALLLGVPAVLPAADSAPAAATPAPERKFTNDELVEMFGWIVGKQTGIGSFDFTEAESVAFAKGIAASSKDTPPYPDKEVEKPFRAFMSARQKKAEDKQLAELEKKAAAGDAEAKSIVEQVKSRRATEEARAAEAAKNLAAGEKFLAEKKQQKGVLATASGLLYEIVQPGKGDYPKATDLVKVNYTGTFIDGKKFDSSPSTGPVEFRLNEVVSGWTEGIQKINKGGKLRLYVPAELAYGEAGRSGIPPNSTLVFDVELVDFKVIPPDAK